MFPLGDSSRRTRYVPVVTILLIVLNFAVFALARRANQPNRPTTVHPIEADRDAATLEDLRWPSENGRYQ